MSNHSFGSFLSAVEPSRLLAELKRIAVEHVGAVPGALFAPIEANLNEALRADTDIGASLGGLQREDLMLLLVLRQRSAIHVMRYREQIARGFDEFSGQALAVRGDAMLGLVGDHELDFHLASERMAEAIGRMFQLPLEILDRRFEALASALGMPPSGSPISPTRLADAFVRTFRDADLTDSLQQLLVQQYEQQLTKMLGELYTRINTELANAGFTAGRREVPVPARAASQKPAPESSQPQPASAPSEAAASPAVTVPANNTAPADLARAPSTAGIDLFRVSPEARVRHQHLRDLLHAWRNEGSSDARAHGSPMQDAPTVGSHVVQGQAMPHLYAAATPHAGTSHSAGFFTGGPAPGASQLGVSLVGPPSLGAYAQGDPAGTHGWGQQGNGTAVRRELVIDELVSVVSLLQRDVYEPFEQALAGKRPLHEAIREHLQDGARRLGLDLEKTCVAQRDADAIDLVGLLFEALLGTHALVGEARHLFARLVMTYVRIALTDDNLFVRPGHPAKRLIDALALSCESNDGASPQDRELLQCASRVVARVVVDYNEDLAIFDLAANELQDLLQQQRRRAEIIERRSAETVHGRERLLQARLQAASALAQRISGRSLTPTVGRFLERYWQHHYVQTLLRGGHGSERALAACAIADQLVALDTAATQRAGSDIADALLALQVGISDCLASSGLDGPATAEWLAGITRAVAFPDTSREPRPLPAMAQLGDDSDDTRLLRVVGGTATLQFDPAIAERMRMLRPGDWLRLLDENEEEGSVKVAWISPLTSRLLLVNRRGVRKLVASPQQLAALVKAGRLLTDAADLPFDEAMRQVQQRLGAVAAA